MNIVGELWRFGTIAFSCFVVFKMGEHLHRDLYRDAPWRTLLGRFALLLLALGWAYLLTAAYGLVGS